MLESFSDTELSIIGNMMTSKSNKTIADLLERPITEIAAVINELKTRDGLSSYQDRIDAKAAERKATAVKKPKLRVQRVVTKQNKKEVEKQKKLLEKQKARQERLNMDEKSRVQREKARGPKFNMRKVDYSQKKTLRIDSKTFIYINPGEDEEAARANFMKTYKKSFNPDEVLKEVKTRVCRRCKDDLPINKFSQSQTASTARRSGICDDCKAAV
jgi:hypothetical protein